MKILKIVLIVVAVLIAVPLITALFVKKDYGVEREITINKPKQQVFDYIKLLKNQDNFSKWAMMDPNTKKTYTGEDGTVDFELRFKKPFEATDFAYMTTESISENETKVKWGFNGKMNYPINIMLLFMDMEKMLGDDLSTGLANLKNVMEKQ